MVCVVDFDARGSVHATVIWSEVAHVSVGIMPGTCVAVPVTVPVTCWEEFRKLGDSRSGELLKGFLDVFDGSAVKVSAKGIWA